MKIIMVFAVLCAIGLFMPRYDLYEKDGNWSDRYLLREKGFWSQDSCKKAGMRFENPYRCSATNTWRGLWGGEQASAN